MLSNPVVESVTDATITILFGARLRENASIKVSLGDVVLVAAPKTPRKATERNTPNHPYIAGAARRIVFLIVIVSDDQIATSFQNRSTSCTASILVKAASIAFDEVLNLKFTRIFHSLGQLDSPALAAHRVFHVLSRRSPVHFLSSIADWDCVDCSECCGRLLLF